MEQTSTANAGRYLMRLMVYTDSTRLVTSQLGNDCWINDSTRQTFTYGSRHTLIERNREDYIVANYPLIKPAPNPENPTEVVPLLLVCLAPPPLFSLLPDPVLDSL
ncbi:hypothetical protein GCM10023187_47090 [Nibrella viscosa]|uniref:Uncharacterized protein n=1 Tax=Nibrella viscosa TaxID=1084524 RepID=A0ABP8KT94_9BACT